jgi:hypothetical protein
MYFNIGAAWLAQNTNVTVICRLTIPIIILSSASNSSCGHLWIHLLMLEGPPAHYSYGYIIHGGPPAAALRIISGYKDWWAGIDPCNRLFCFSQHSTCEYLNEFTRPGRRGWFLGNSFTYGYITEAYFPKLFVNRYPRPQYQHSWMAQSVARPAVNR